MPTRKTIKSRMPCFFFMEGRLHQNHVCVKCIITDMDSLQHFAADFLCFHLLTSSLLQNRGVGRGSMAIFFQSQATRPKKKKPRITLGGRRSGAWGLTARTGP